MLIIALASSTGPGSGKTSLARYIQRIAQHKSKPSQILSFAEPVKKLADAVLHCGPIRPTVGKDDPIPGLGFSKRDAYIAVGEVGRTIDPCLWVDLLISKVDRFVSNGVVIIDDLRKEAEYEALRLLDKTSGGSHEVVIVNVVNGDFPIPGLDSTDIPFNRKQFDAHILNYPSGQQKMKIYPSSDGPGTIDVGKFFNDRM